MTLQRETVAIPVSKGIDVRTAARLVQPQFLLEAKNTRFNLSGASKRRGHSASKIRSGQYTKNITAPDISKPSVTPYGAKILDSAWLFGWGALGLTDTSDITTNYNLSPYPEALNCFGGAARDEELLAWDGQRLLSYSPSQATSGYGAEVTPAVMPVLRSEQIAKSNKQQIYPDAADNGTVRVVCWLDNQSHKLVYSAFDSVTGATLVHENHLVVTTPAAPRIVNLGPYFHIIVVDTDTSLLATHSFHQETLTTITKRSLGDCALHFDFWKVQEDTAVILKTDNTRGAMFINWITTNGSLHPDYTSNQAIDLLVADVPLQCAIAVHPITQTLCIAYYTTIGSVNPEGLYAWTFTKNGESIDTRAAIDTSPDSTKANRVTIAPRYVMNTVGDDPSSFDIYYSFVDGTHPRLGRATIFSDGGSTPAQITKWHHHVASHAFMVGGRTFVWSSYNSTLQSSWFLLDENLNPIGRHSFSTANTPAISESSDLTQRLFSVNWQQFNTVKDQCVFHNAFSYKQRVNTTDDQIGLFTEPSVIFSKIDFLPSLRSAQAGRCTYFPGAQLWSYDGTELTEAGFHLAPEFTLAGVLDTGALTVNGTYSYRVDLCYRNAQNEEIRSASLFQQFILTTTQREITVTIKSTMTRRTNSYFLIFRNAMVSGAPTSSWNLLNSRDPSSADFRLNDQTQDTITFTDAGTISDTAIQARENSPMNVSNYVQPFSAPACEIIGAGRDRLWVAGGELPPGQIAPSRLFDPGEIPAFNANINMQIDRSNEPVTAIGFVGDVVAVFRPRSTYIVDGDGPDNVASGFWSPPRLALADTGATSPEGLGLVDEGLAFQSPAGMRLLGPGGKLEAIGAPVDSIGAVLDVVACVVISEDQEIRWYGKDLTLVYHYLKDSWSTWTITGASALRNLDTGMAVVITGDGQFFKEEDDFYLDGSTPFEHRIRFPWLYGGNIGDFQRIVRIAGFGETDGDPHQIRVDMYYDERSFPEEYWIWNYPDATQDTDTWGTLTWGAGSWGDNATTNGIRDSVWRWRRRPRRQKCSVFSVAIGDNYSTTAGFRLVALGLEVAKKTGLDRTAVPGGSDTFR